MTRPDMTDRQQHWDDAYRTKGVEGVSWYQSEPATSLELIALLEVDHSERVVDIGGGASLLVDRLVAEGFADVTVLDVSAVALEEPRRRLRGHAGVTFIEADILAWQPPQRSIGLWHDRAVFHFLTDEQDRGRYLATLSEAVKGEGFAVLGTFAEDGPEYCSGLPVARYSPAELAETLGQAFTPIATRRELHRTPAGATQSFSWIAARRSSGRAGAGGGTA